MKPKLIDFYMNIASNAADISTCERLKVGCVLARGDKLLDVGYNGTLPDEDNCCEDEDNNTKDDVLHAEENVIFKIAMSGETTKGATAFITHQPCLRCSRMLVRCGITAVYFKEAYRCYKGIKLLKKRGVKVYQYK